MTNDFAIKWLLSLLVGSVWIIVSTTIAERISGRLGGLITGLPSTVVVALLFIGLTQGVDAAKTASAIMPLSVGLYSFFSIAYLLLSRKNFVTAFAGSLAVWFLFAIVASLINPSFVVSILLWFVLVTLSISWTVKNISINSNQIPKNIKGRPVWFKALLGGVVISSVVLISKLAGPKWGGISATFPALTISTLLVTIKSGGLEFTRLIAKNILISTTTTVGLLAIISYIMFPILGPIIGMVISYTLVLLISIPLYHLVFEKLKN